MSRKTHILLSSSSDLAHGGQQALSEALFLKNLLLQACCGRACSSITLGCTGEPGGRLMGITFRLASNCPLCRIESSHP